MKSEFQNEVHKKMDKGHAKYLYSLFWKPVNVTLEDLEGGKTFGIDDEFPHRMVISAYTLNKSFFNTFASGSLKKWTWPQVHSMISRNILEREDLTAILFRQKPKSNDLVYEYDDYWAGETREFDQSFAYKKLRESSVDPRES